MPSDKLHKFIRSLSSNEKRYLTIQLQKNNSLYSSLFNQISTQKVYDEEALKQLFPDINFQFVKTYLFKTILKLLSDFDTKEKDTYKLSLIKVLIKRGNYAEANRMLKNAIKSVSTGEDYLLQLNLIKQAKTLLTFYSYKYEELLLFVKKEAQILILYKNQSTYQSLYAEIIAVYNTTKDMKKILSLKEHPYLKNDCNVTDDRCRLFYHLSKVLLAYVTNDRVFMGNHFESLLVQINDPMFYNKLEDSLKTRVLRLIIVVSLLWDLDKSQLIIDRFKKLIDNIKTYDISWNLNSWSIYYNVQFCLYVYKNDLPRAELFLKKSDLFFDTNKKNISTTNLMSYEVNKITYFFMSKQYRKTLIEINDFLFTYDTGEMVYIHIKVLMIEMISFIELNKIDLAENKLNSLIRFVKKYNPKAEIFQYFITLFKAIIFDKDFSKEVQQLIEYVSINFTDSSVKASETLINWAKTKI